MKIEEFERQIELLYAEGGVSEVIGVLAETVRKHSDGQWEEGNCKYSSNLSVVADVLDILYDKLDLDYRRASNDELYEAITQIRQDLEDILI